MRRIKLVFIVFATILLLGGPALALTLTEDFSAAVINNSSLTTSSGLNQWNDLVRWQITPTGGNPGAWAEHTPNPTGGDETSLLFYGFDATGLGNGTSFSLSFDFINGGGSRDGIVYFGGLDASESESISQYAPWASLSSTYFYSSTIIDGTNSWTSSPTLNGVVVGDHDVLYVAFQMGGYSGPRGIDNINLQVGTTSVPEPATMILFGTGLIVAAALGRKKFLKN